MLIWKGHTRIIKSNSGFCDLKPSTCCLVLCEPLKTMLDPRSVRKTHQARLQQAGSSGLHWAHCRLGSVSQTPPGLSQFIPCMLAGLCGKEDKTQDLWGLFSHTFCLCVPVKHQFEAVKGVYAVQPTESSFSCVFLKIQIRLTQFLAQLFPSTFCFVKLWLVNVPC